MAAPEEEGDEEDYMSDAFLASLASSSHRSSSSSSTTPATTATHVDPRSELPSWKRKAAVEKGRREALALQQEQSRKRMREREEEQRAQGLQAPLARNNKGFAMLLKMGFTEGAGLGKKAEGRAEPVPITIKEGRAGLGKASAQAERVAMWAAAQAMRQERMQQQTRSLEDMQAGFVQRARQRMAGRRVARELRDAQRACEQLDSMMGLERSEMWPAEATEGGENEEEDDDDAKEKRGRKESADETEDNDDLEQAAGEQGDAAARARQAAGAEDFASLEDADKLSLVCAYLRRAHCYCLWCGRAFASAPALLEGCPGETAEDHDA